MSFRRTLAAGLLASLGPIAGTLAAEEPTERVLIPVYTFDPIPGVNGSSWVADLWVSNSGTADAIVDGVFWDCFLPGCGPAHVEPGVSFRAGLQAIDGLHGALLYLEPSTASNVGFGLRFRDLSRQATTWGTELPMPREGAFRSSKFSLVDVPVTPGFRQTLRVYELDGTPRAASARVRVYRLDPDHSQPYDDPDELLGETVLPLEFQPVVGARPEQPGYAQVTDLSTLAPLGDAERLRIEIEPVTEGLKLWAFVAIAHNESQHATVVSPQ